MPDESNKPTYDVTEDARLVHPAIVPAGEDIPPGPPTAPEQIKRDEFSAWIEVGASTVFGQALPRLFSKVFGDSPDSTFRFRAVTELQNNLAWLDRWQTRLGGDARLDAIIQALDRDKDYRLGILVHHRPLGQLPLFVDGTPLESAASFINFERERWTKWGATFGSKAWTGRGCVANSFELREFFSLRELRDRNSNRIDIIVICDSLEHSWPLAKKFSHIFESAKFQDWEAIQRWVADAFQRLGGDLSISLDLVHEKWQDRWVAPKHVPNVPPPDIADPLAELKPPPLSDLMSIRSAASKLGIDKTVIQDAIDAKKIAVHKLGDDTITVSLTECREFRDHGRRPRGRPRKES